MKLELEVITSNLYNIFIFFPKLEFCKRKGKKYTRTVSYLNKPQLSKHMYLLSTLSVPVEGVTCVNGITCMPMLKRMQGRGPNEDSAFEEAGVFRRKFQSESLQLWTREQNLEWSIQSHNTYLPHCVFSLKIRFKYISRLNAGKMGMEHNTILKGKEIWPAVRWPIFFLDMGNVQHI